MCGQARPAIGVELLAAIGSGKGATPAQIALAWLLARVDFRGRGAVRALCLLSMVLPPVVGGVALFFATLPAGLGFLLLVPVFSGAVYASYRDIFVEV